MNTLAQARREREKDKKIKEQEDELRKQKQKMEQQYEHMKRQAAKTAETRQRLDVWESVEEQDRRADERGQKAIEREEKTLYLQDLQDKREKQKEREKVKKVQADKQRIFKEKREEIAEQIEQVEQDLKIDFDKFVKILATHDCRVLAKIARVYITSNSDRKPVKSLDRVDLAEFLAEYMVEHDLLPVSLEDLDKHFPDCKASRSEFVQRWWSGNAGNEPRLVCAIVSLSEQYTSHMKDKYKDLRCYRPDKVPSFGLRVKSDCPKGYVQLDEDGCCVQINNYLQLWNENGMANTMRTNDNLTLDEKDTISDYLSGMRNVNQNIMSEVGKFGSQTEAEYFVQMMSQMQYNTVIHLQRTMKDMLGDSAEDGDSCLTVEGRLIPQDKIAEEAAGWMMKSLGFIASMSAPVLVVSFRLLWFFIRKVLKISWKVLRVPMRFANGVVWAVSSRLEAMAKFIVTNPRSARMFAAAGMVLKNHLCKFIGKVIVDYGEKLLEALEKQIQERLPDLVKHDQFGKRIPMLAAQQYMEKNLGDDFHTSDTMTVLFDGTLQYIVDSGEMSATRMTSRVLENTDLLQNVGGIGGRLAGSLMEGIPFIGPALRTSSEIIGEMVGGAAQVAASEVVQLMMYQQDITAVMRLLYQLTNPLVCLAKMEGIELRYPHIYHLFMFTMPEQLGFVNEYAQGVGRQSILDLRQLAGMAAREEILTTSTTTPFGPALPPQPIPITTPTPTFPPSTSTNTTPYLLRTGDSLVRNSSNDGLATRLLQPKGNQITRQISCRSSKTKR